MLKPEQTPPDAVHAWQLANFEPSYGIEHEMDSLGEHDYVRAAICAPRELDLGYPVEEQFVEVVQQGIDVDIMDIGYAQRALKRTLGGDKAPGLANLFLGSISGWARAHGAERTIFAANVTDTPEYATWVLALYDDRPRRGLDNLAWATDFEQGAAYHPQNISLAIATRGIVNKLSSRLTIVSGDQCVNVTPDADEPSGRKFDNYALAERIQGTLVVAAVARVA
jgi:hypothetical protein